jgi:hypothetical protein
LKLRQILKNLHSFFTCHDAFPKGAIEVLRHANVIAWRRPEAVGAPLGKFAKGAVWPGIVRERKASFSFYPAAYR